MMGKIADWLLNLTAPREWIPDLSRRIWIRRRHGEWEHKPMTDDEYEEQLEYWAIR